MKKCSILNLVGVLSIFFLSSCGGTQDSPLLGKVPGLCINEFKERAELLKEMEGLGDSDKSGFEAIIKKGQEREKYYDEQCAIEYSAIIGKEIPTEIEAGAPCKITIPITITESKKNKRIELKGELELLEDIKFDKKENPYDGGSNLSLILINSKGEPLMSLHPGHIREKMYLDTETVPAGKKAEIDTFFVLSEKNVESLKDFSKIIIVNKRTSKLYETAHNIKY